MNNTIEVIDLKAHFSVDGRLIKAVDGVSFCVPEGKTLALVGESGSGKSVTALSIMRLLTGNTNGLIGGAVLFDGVNLMEITEKEMAGIRGKDIGMIFQEPTRALNPVIKIGDQIKETAMIHKGASRREAKKDTVNILKQLGFDTPEIIFNKYPHQLSGGMNQRVMIAMAIICHPRLLIADEPTTALDVTIQAAIISLIKELQIKLTMSIIFITHDIGVVAEVADYVAVMCDGKIVEHSDVTTFFANAKHPRSLELLNAIRGCDTEIVKTDTAFHPSTYSPG